MNVIGPHDLTGSGTTGTRMALLEEVDNMWRSRWQFLLEEKLQRPSAVYTGVGSSWDSDHLQGFVFGVQWEAALPCPLYFPTSYSFFTVCSKQILVKQEHKQVGRWRRGHRYHPGTSLNLTLFSYDVIGCFSCLRHKSVIREQMIMEVHGSA